MAEARGNYTYRQSVLIEDVEPRGARLGEYREEREVIFTPEGKRLEQPIGKPFDNLKRLKLTEEDFRDIREVQPFLLDRSQLWLYQTEYKGEETMDGVECWVLRVSPRQILEGQRLFEGMLWIAQPDFSITRLEGRAVPQHFGKSKENLFPRFTTFRELVDGKYWFPVHTHGDDMLPFASGPVRMRLTIRYRDYKRFTAESTVTFQK